MVKVNWSKQAIEDIHRIQEYYLGFSVSYGFKLVDQIFEKEELISLHPEIGRIVPEVNSKNLREIIFKNFRIIYVIYDSR